MFQRLYRSRQYKLGYFARKHKLDRESARLILGVSIDASQANRLARQLKMKVRS